MDTKPLRTAFGRIPTGVSVVTTLDAQGRPLGLTANSVVPAGGADLHLAWSLARASRSRSAFAAAGVFGVSLLAEHQELVSRHMAAAAEDRFAGVAWRAGRVTGVPLIEGSLAVFECTTVYIEELGDHLTFIGRVRAFSCRPPAGPLLFANGRYAARGPRLDLQAQGA